MLPSQTSGVVLNFLDRCRKSTFVCGKAGLCSHSSVQLRSGASPTGIFRPIHHHAIHGTCSEGFGGTPSGDGSWDCCWYVCSRSTMRTICALLLQRTVMTGSTSTTCYHRPTPPTPLMQDRASFRKQANTRGLVLGVSVFFFAFTILVVQLFIHRL